MSIIAYIAHGIGVIYEWVLSYSHTNAFDFCLWNGNWTAQTFKLQLETSGKTTKVETVKRTKAALDFFRTFIAVRIFDSSLWFVATNKLDIFVDFMFPFFYVQFFFFVTYFLWNEFQNIQMINYSGWLVMPCVYSTTTIQSVVIRTLIFEIKSPYCLINGLSFCIQYKSGQIGWCDLLYHRCKSPFILSIKSYSSFATSYINKNQF